MSVFDLIHLLLSPVEHRQETDEFEPSSSWDDGNMYDGPADYGNDQSDGEDPNALVSQPRQVCSFLYINLQLLFRLSRSRSTKVASIVVTHSHLHTIFPNDLDTQNRS